MTSNVVGDGRAAISSGDVLSQSGRSARLAGSDGAGSLVEYLAPAPADPGREAWMISGGNAEVVYASPHQHR